MDTKSRSDWNAVFSIFAIIIGVLSILYCSTHVLEPLGELKASQFFTELSRTIRGGVE